MEHTQVHLSEIKARIKRFREALDFSYDILGSGNHRHLSYPVSIREVETFERKFAISLPYEFRQFLLEIGISAGPYYGIGSPFCIECEIEEWLESAYYGIFSPSDIECDVGERIESAENITMSPALAFPLTLNDAVEIYQKRNRGVEHPYIIENFQCNGCVPIGLQGNAFWTVLVTAGELRGTIWDVGRIDVHVLLKGKWSPAKRPPGIVRDGFKPVALPPISPIPTFNEWLVGWLEQCEADLAKDRESPSTFLGKLFKRITIV